MLTREDLKGYEHGIFKQGEVIQGHEKFRWVAVRGGVDDWAIYIGPVEKSFEWINHNGDKIYFENTIKDLIPCTEEAYKRYRS